MPQASGIVVNGWAIFAHPLFLDEVLELTEKVERHKAKDPGTYKKKNASKRLAAILKLALTDIPQDPADPKYRQGDTLGDGRKFWFRAKFFQQYRLFFRFHSEAKVIIYAWVNDEHHKRAYGSRTDAYTTFEKMLESGHPPDDWDQLYEQARKDAGAFQRTLERLNDE